MVIVRVKVDEQLLGNIPEVAVTLYVTSIGAFVEFDSV